MIGDQVYADEDAPETRRFIRERRGTDGEPGDEVADFEEYTRLYRETWGDETIRWLLSVVPVGDDLRRPRRPRRLEHLDLLAGGDAGEAVVGSAGSRGHSPATGSTRHLGNFSPDEIEERGILAHVKSEPDAGHALHEWARDVDCGSDGRRWSFSRDLGRRPAGDAGLTRGPRPRRAPATDVRRGGVEWLERVITGDVRPPDRSRTPCRSSCRRRSTTSSRGTTPWPPEPGRARSRGIGERIRRCDRPGALGRVPALVRAASSS